MNTTRLWLLPLTLAVTWLGGAPAAPALAQDPTPTLRRYALIAASNDGGAGRARLRFADSDARAVAGVLTQLGGVQRDDLSLLPNATRSGLQAAFEQLRAKLALAREGQPRSELVVYYSGHSDEFGLLVGAERLTYDDLRAWIDATQADVRIAIFDSCASGAVIRRRGGVQRASFLSDLSVDARGYAFLTASSADEAAQESDRISAGFFTHYLVSGLRGAADRSGDHRVTLAEAYQFAYDETLHRTQTAPQAQHPAYDINLTGAGDLVLTDLRSTDASLVLADALAGRVYVRDGSGRLVVELDKRRSQTVRLGLSAGAYHVTVEDADRHLATKLELERGTSVVLNPEQFTPLRAQIVAARGPTPAAAPEADRPPPAAPATLLDRLPTFGAYAGLGFRYANLVREDGLLAGLEAALLLDHRLALGVAAYGWSAERANDRVTFGYAGVILRYHFLFDSPFSFSIAALGAAGGVQRRLEARTRSIDDGVFVFEPQLGGHLTVAPFLRLGVDFGYRVVAGVDAFEPSDLRGFLGGVHAQLGWF